MAEYRPRIKVDRTPLLWISDMVSYGGLLYMVVLVIRKYPELPDRIATHFGFNGKADGWGSKSSIVFLPIITLMVTLTISIVEQFPHLCNYSVKLTEGNAGKQYAIAVSMLAWLKAIIVVMLSYITYATIESALASKGRIGSGVIVFMVVLIFGTLGWHIRQSVRNK